jgi:Permuted papain-like amidase enzyme, YaeF/YiiX, C92 family
VRGNTGEGPPAFLRMRTGAGRALALLLVLAGATGCPSRGLPAVQEGDVIFQTSETAQSLAVQKATHSRYSHVGLVTFRDGQPYVFEAVATVRATPLSEWLAHGEGGHYVVKRLVDAHQVFNPASIVEFDKELRHFEGKGPYDRTFEWSDERLYCSELVWKVYERSLGIRLGEPQRLRDLDLSAPEVQTKLAERFGGNVPLDEPVISLQRIFDSARLETVAER